MSEPLITVLIVGPVGSDVQVVPADYREFNRLVSDGSIASCPLPPSLRQRGFYAYCDDDGIARDLPQNRWATHFGHAVLRGPIVVFRAGPEGDEQGLSVDDLAYLLKYFTDPPTLEARGLALQNADFWARYPSGIAAFDMPDDNLTTRGTLVAVCTACDWTSRPAKATDRHETDSGHVIRYVVEG